MARKVRRPRRGAAAKQAAAQTPPASEVREAAAEYAGEAWLPVTERPEGRRLAAAREAELAALPAAERQAREEEEARMAGYLTVAEAAARTGTTRFHISRLVKREGLTTYVQRADRRKKFLRAADIDKLMRPEPAPPPDAPGTGGAE